MLIRYHRAIRAHDKKKANCAGACESEAGECMGGGCTPTTDCLPLWKELVAWIVIGVAAILCLYALLDAYADTVASWLLGGR